MEDAMGFWRRRDDEDTSDDRKSLNDEQAIERYRYMLRTAPPETIQQAHEEAFARLTPDQRRMVLQELTRSVPAEESRRATDDPASLARLATRTEIRQPGMLERVFGSSHAGGGFGGSMAMGLGGMFAGSLLASIAGTFIASSIAHSFFDQHPFDGDTASGGNEVASSDYGSDAVEDPGADTADAGFGDLGESFDGGDIEI
jgi:hypothetical protein